MADAGKMTFQRRLSPLLVAALGAVSILGCTAQERTFGAPDDSGGGSSGDGGSSSGGSDGTGGASGGSGGSKGGSGGTSGTGGTADGGSGGGTSVCEGGEPACDGDRATTCLEDGTGYEPGGTVCEGNQECRDGACADKPCTVDELFCVGKELRKCTDGTNYSVEATCGNDEFCNGTDKVCSPQVCSPGTHQCGAGGQPQVCAEDGSSWVNDGAACSGDNPTCRDGVCICVTNTERCSPSGDQPQRCNAVNAWVAREEPCTGAMYSGCRKASADQFAKAQCVATTVPMSYAENWDRVVGARTSRTSIDNFRLDKYEVTVGQFRRFVDAYTAATNPWRPKSGDGRHTHLNGGNGLKDGGPAGGNETGWSTAWTPKLFSTHDDWTYWLTHTGNPPAVSSYATWTASVGANESMPMNMLTWYEAYAYCIWDGGFLPTEAEWEWAARNGNQAWKYPWPNTLTLGNNATLAVYGCFFPDGNATCTGRRNIAKVDEGPALLEHSKWAHLGGNVWEWTLDWHLGAEGAPPTYPDDCANCAVLSGATALKTHRGGDFYWGKDDMETAAHRVFNADWRDHFGGVRCARSSNQF